MNDKHRAAGRGGIEEFRAKGAQVDSGAFGENLVVDGIAFRCLPAI